MTSIFQILLISVFCSLAAAHWGEGGCDKVPDVVKNLSKTQKDQVEAIFEDNTLTRAQVWLKVSEWVDKQNISELSAFYKNVTNKMQTMKTKLDSLQSNLTQEVQPLATQIKTVLLNDNLTFLDTCNQINSLASGTTDAIRKQLHLEVRDCSTAIQSGLNKIFSCGSSSTSQ